MGADYGLLVDYDWCTGCHSCEIACQMEHGFEVGQGGVQVVQVGPWMLADGQWQYDFYPVLTDMCDMCAKRLGAGKTPTCVSHCQAQCLSFGLIKELVPQLKDHKKQTLYSM